MLFLVGYCVVATLNLNGAYLKQINHVALDDWSEFRKDYHERYGRMPPDTMKEWLRYARYYNCNERDYYNGIEEDLRSYRQRINRTGLFQYDDVVPSGLKQTDNYLAFQIENNEIRTVASYNYHLNFVQQGEIEKNLRWILEPLKDHHPPIRTLVFFDLHDHPSTNTTTETLPMFTTSKMGYLTENQPPPQDGKDLQTFLANAFDTSIKAMHEHNKEVLSHSPFHKDFPDSYDCQSLLVPYYFGLGAAHAYPFMEPWNVRDETIVWRGGTTGYDWGKSPRFRLMNLFAGSGNQPHPMPKGSNPIVPGVDADFAFTAVVQNYTSEHHTMAPNWRMAPFMGPDEVRKYKYIMDVDGNSFTSRFSTILRSGSVVFKSTRFREWFSERVKPFVDYIPVNYDLSDFKEKVAWIHNHPEVAEKMAEHSKMTSMNHMRDEDMRCYTYRLVLEYSTLFS